MVAPRPRTARNTVVVVSKGESTTYKPGDLMPPIVDLDHVQDDGPVFEGTDVPQAYLFKYLDERYNLYAFLGDFPQVSKGQAVAAIRERVNANITIHSDRRRVSGTPVFKGTRVFARSLFEYLAQGYTVEIFLDQFPSTEREQIVRTLELASQLLESMAYESAPG